MKDAEIIEKLNRIEKELLLHSSNKLENYNKGEKVHKKQLEFHKNMHRNRWVFGGNRSGKTECGAVETVWLARGIHPFKPNKKDVCGWVVSLSTQVQRDVAQAKIFSYLNKDWIQDIKMSTGRKDSPEFGVVDTIIIKNIFGGLSKIGFKTERKEKFLIMSNKKDCSLGFLGHTDTVEYTEGWKYEKFNTTKIENRIYGLGVCDMKSGIAAMISSISQIDFNKMKNGIKLYFTYDEEIGFSGIKDVLKYEKTFPDIMIIGEPTNNEIIVGSKGLIEYKISFKGIKAHSSTPDKGKNAIMDAVSFINDLNYFYEKELRQNTNTNFEIPYTTMNIGKITGGSAINSVPDSCEFLVDFRTIDIYCESLIMKKINDLKNQYSCDIQEINRISPFINNIENSKKTCNFITEASFLKNNRVILGVGNITAHEVDENIDVDSLYQLVEQYKYFIKKYCN